MFDMTVERRSFVAAVCCWAIFLVWLGWLYRSGRVYSRDLLEHLASQANLPVYTPGDVVTWKDNKEVLLSGWYEPEARFRWSGGRKAVFLFRLQPGWNREATYSLRMHFADSIGTEHVKILFNKSAVAEFTLRGAGSVDAPVDGRLLHEANVVELVLPDARQPGTADLRVLAVAMVDFVLRPAGPA
jgi:hypothetical protein